MDAFLDKFAHAWRRLDAAPEARCNVALSGGVDSAVLLAAVRALEPERPIRAIHVDHGLQAASAGWRQACERAAAAARAELVVRAVDVDAHDARGLEAAAREARYAAFAAVLEPGETLLTAHHADDQLETMLMRVFRGTGVGGLAAVRAEGSIAGLRVVRPLLEFTRAELEAQARAWGLEHVDDPSNDDTRFDRNFIRHHVVPGIRERWPGAARAAVRTARQMAAAEHVLEDVAIEDLGLEREPDAATAATVDLERLRALSPARRDNALRHLIRRAGLPLPTAAQLASLAEALAVERRDAGTRVAWPGAEARIHRGRLHVLAPLPPRTPAADARLAPGHAWRGAAGRLELVAAGAEAPGLPESWLADGLEIRFRAGGERFKPLADTHTREVKKLFQEAGIVPWMRERIPLLYAAGELVAIADLWLTDRVRAAPADEPAWRVRWSDHPPLR